MLAQHPGQDQGEDACRNKQRVPLHYSPASSDISRRILATQKRRSYATIHRSVGLRVPGHAHRSSRTRMANQEQDQGVLLLRWLNCSEVLVQLLLICLLECATIHNVMDVTEG